MATRLLTAAPICSGGAEDLQVVVPAGHHDDVLGARRRWRCVDSGRDHVVEATCTGVSSGSSPCSRDSSMICWTSRESRSLSCSIRRAKRCTASGSSAASVDRLGEQPDGADRRLELVADVGHEVAAHRLDPPLAGAVLDQGQDQAGAQGGHAGSHRAGGATARRGELQLGLADLAVAADLRSGRAARDEDLVAAHQPEGVRRCGGLEDVVGLVDHDGAGSQDGQHRGHARAARAARRRGAGGAAGGR